jgi:hypothetical protein
VSEFTFTDEEVAKCKAAMDKPSPLQALRAIVSGEVTVTLDRDGRNVTIDTYHGKTFRDADYPGEDRRVGLAGAWPLFRAGLIDEDGSPTSLGREMAKVQS